MPATSFLLAWSWSPWVTTPAVLVGLWCAFWIYVWIRYFPIVVRLIGQAPLLVPEPSAPLPDGEACSFPTADGLTLRGTYLKQRADQRRGVVLFGHELHGDRWNAVPYVADLLDAGYDVLTFDFRNHGESDARPGFTPRPWIAPDDVTDVRAAVDFLTSRSDADPRGVGVLGISRGGGAALCAAAGDQRIRCLFTDGAYPSRTTHLLYLKRYIDIFIPPPSTVITRILPDWVYQGFLGAGRWWWGVRNNYRFVDVETTVAGVKQPVLMIHGAADTMIPVEAARALRKCISGPSKLWVVPEARHNGAVFAEPEAYRRRLLKFFRLHLSPPKRRGRRRETDAATAASSPS
jgi:pimeloyl-ACP methyl ester carboxylesterase